MATAIGAADPEALRPRETANPELSPAERALLLRARGRRWNAATPEELAAFLADDARETRVLYIWGEAEGGEGLRAFQTALAGWDAGAVSAAVVLAARDVSDDAIVSLRSSQVPYPAYVTAPGARLGGHDLRGGEAFVTGARAPNGQLARVPLGDLAKVVAD